jgi:hypothetical protein
MRTSNCRSFTASPVDFHVRLSFLATGETTPMMSTAVNQRQTIFAGEFRLGGVKIELCLDGDADHASRKNSSISVLSIGTLPDLNLTVEYLVRSQVQSPLSAAG